MEIVDFLIWYGGLTIHSGQTLGETMLSFPGSKLTWKLMTKVKPKNEIVSGFLL